MVEPLTSGGHAVVVPGLAAASGDVVGPTLAVLGFLAALALAVWGGWARYTHYRPQTEALRERAREALRPPTPGRDWVDLEVLVRASNARLPWPRTRVLTLRSGWLGFTAPGTTKPSVEVAVERLWMTVNDRDRLVIYGPSIAPITISLLPDATDTGGPSIIDDSPLVAALAANGVRVPSASRPRLPEPAPPSVPRAAPRRSRLRWPWARRPVR